MSDIKSEAKNLLSTLDNKGVSNEIDFLNSNDPVEELKLEVLKFFKNRISSIQRSEKLKELVYKNLENQLEQDELNFDQLITILTRLDNGANASSDSIISMFRPTSGNQASMSDLLKPNTDRSELALAFSKYTPEQLQMIEETMQVIRSITNSEPETVPISGTE